MSMRLGTRSGVQSEINVTPFIDIALVLLILFLVMTPLIDRGYAVSLGHSNAGPTQQLEPLSLHLEANGRITVDGRVIVRGDLAAHLRRELGPGSDRPLRIHAEGEASYSEVANLLDLCRHAGAGRIALDLQDETNSQQP